MVVVVLAWLYVIMVFALGQNSVAAGVCVALFLGVCPMLLLAWLLRRRRRMRIAQRQSHHNA